jgi:hypothetical protein
MVGLRNEHIDESRRKRAARSSGAHAVRPFFEPNPRAPRACRQARQKPTQSKELHAQPLQNL